MRVLFLFLFLCIIGRSGFPAPTSAIVYEKDSNRQKELYHWKRSEQGNAAHLNVKLEFIDLEGKPAAVEEALTENGKLLSYTVKQLQLNEQGKLEVGDKKIHFEYTRGGKTETNDEDRAENLVVVPTIVDYLGKNWSTLESGKSVPVRLAVLDRKETVGFEFFKQKDKETLDSLVIKMKPSSLFIAAIVDPLFFTFDKTGATLREIVGRTLPKRKVDNRWRDLDADIVYSYEK